MEEKVNAEGVDPVREAERRVVNAAQDFVDGGSPYFDSQETLRQELKRAVGDLKEKRLLESTPTTLGEASRLVIEAAYQWADADVDPPQRHCDRVLVRAVARLQVLEAEARIRAGRKPAPRRQMRLRGTSRVACVVDDMGPNGVIFEFEDDGERVRISRRDLAGNWVDAGDEPEGAMPPRVRIGEILRRVHDAAPAMSATVIMHRDDYIESMRDLLLAGADVLGEPITIVSLGVVVAFIQGDDVPCGGVRITIDDDHQVAEKPTPLAVGDVVRLKSGGPAMTVTFTTGSPGADIECTWFDGAAEMRRFFSKACLELLPRLERLERREVCEPGLGAIGVAVQR